MEAATLFLSVRVLVKKCPELEARMCLLAPPKKPKRRLSTPPERLVQPNIKRRRISVFVSDALQINDDEDGLTPFLDASNKDLTLDRAINNHCSSPERHLSTMTDTHDQTNIRRSLNSAFELVTPRHLSQSNHEDEEIIENPFFDASGDEIFVEPDENDDFTEPLIYMYCSSPELIDEPTEKITEEQPEPNENSVNTDRKDLADKISVGIQNLHKILARRHSLPSRSIGNIHFLSARIKKSIKCAQNMHLIWRR